MCMHATNSWSMYKVSVLVIVCTEFMHLCFLRVCILCVCVVCVCVYLDVCVTDEYIPMSAYH